MVCVELFFALYTVGIGSSSRRFDFFNITLSLLRFWSFVEDTIVPRTSMFDFEDALLLRTSLCRPRHLEFTSLRNPVHLSCTHFFPVVSVCHLLAICCRLTCTNRTKAGDTPKGSMVGNVRQSRLLTVLFRRAGKTTCIPL